MVITPRIGTVVLFIDSIFTKVHIYFGLWYRYTYIIFTQSNSSFLLEHPSNICFLPAQQEFHYFFPPRSFPQLNFQPFPSVFSLFHLLLILLHYSFRISQDYKCCLISLLSREERKESYSFKTCFLCFVFYFIQCEAWGRYCNWSRGKLDLKGPQVKTTKPIVSIKVTNCSIQLGLILGVSSSCQKVRFFHFVSGDVWMDGWMDEYMDVIVFFVHDFFNAVKSIEEKLKTYHQFNKMKR